MIIATYLKFNGKCEEALNFYKEIFNASVICMYKLDEFTTQDKQLIGKVFHAELKIDDFYIYMSDTSEGFDYEKQAYKITVESDTLEDANNYFNSLKDNGEVFKPIEKTPWGPYMGHLRDKFGITWDIVYCKPE